MDMFYAACEELKDPTLKKRDISSDSTLLEE